MVSPVLVASSDPVVTCWLDVSIKALISLAAVALRCASVRTPPPRPRSRGPVRRPRGFHRRVQRQDIGLEGMPSMTEMISWTLAELAAMSAWWRSCAAWPGRRPRLSARRPAPSRCPVARFRCFVSRRTSAVPCWRRSAPATQPAPRCDPRDRIAARELGRRGGNGVGGGLDAGHGRAQLHAHGLQRGDQAVARRRWDAGSASGCHWRSRAPFPGPAAARRQAGAARCA